MPDEKKERVFHCGLLDIPSVSANMASLPEREKYVTMARNVLLSPMDKVFPDTVTTFEGEEHETVKNTLERLSGKCNAMPASL